MQPAMKEVCCSRNQKRIPPIFFPENQIPTLNLQSEASNPAPQNTEKTFSLI